MNTWTAHDDARFHAAADLERPVRVDYWAGRAITITTGLALITGGVVAGLTVTPLSGAHLAALSLIAAGGALISRVAHVATIRKDHS